MRYARGSAPTDPSAGYVAHMSDADLTLDPNCQLARLHRAIHHAASSGVSWQWITGVLAGCLADETPTMAAREVAIETLRRAAISSPHPSAA